MEMRSCQRYITGVPALNYFTWGIPPPLKRILPATKRGQRSELKWRASVPGIVRGDLIPRRNGGGIGECASRGYIMRYTIFLLLLLRGTDPKPRHARGRRPRPWGSKSRQPKLRPHPEQTDSRTDPLLTLRSPPSEKEMRHLLIILTLKSAKRAISLGGQLQIPHAVCRALFSPCFESFSSDSKSRSEE